MRPPQSSSARGTTGRPPWHEASWRSRAASACFLRLSCRYRAGRGGGTRKFLIVVLLYGGNCHVDRLVDPFLRRLLPRRRRSHLLRDACRPGRGLLRGGDWLRGRRRLCGRRGEFRRCLRGLGLGRRRFRGRRGGFHGCRGDNLRGQRRGLRFRGRRGGCGRFLRGLDRRRCRHRRGGFGRCLRGLRRGVVDLRPLS